MNKSNDYTMLNGMHSMQAKIAELQEEEIEVYAVDPETFRRYLGLLTWKYEKTPPDGVTNINYMGIDIITVYEIGSFGGRFATGGTVYGH